MVIRKERGLRRQREHNAPNGDDTSLFGASRLATMYSAASVSAYRRGTQHSGARGWMGDVHILPHLVGGITPAVAPMPTIN